jgi:WD40 repeat protein
MASSSPAPAAARGALGTLWHDILGGRFSGANGTTVRIWRVSDGELQQALAGHSDSAWNLAFSSNGCGSPAVASITR